jgi:hypothetical protein
MDDGIRPVSFVLGDGQEDGSTAGWVAALTDELQPLGIDETRAILGLVGSSMALHVNRSRERGSLPDASI